MLAKKKQESDGLMLLGMGEGFHSELCTMLESAALFRDFERPDIESLAKYSGAYKASKGTKIFTEGERGSFMCVLVTGRIEIIKEHKDISTIRAGKTMGEMSIVDGMPYSATAVAAEECTMVYITKANFDKFVKIYPSAAIQFYQQIARLMSLRLRQTTGILCDYL